MLLPGRPVEILRGDLKMINYPKLLDIYTTVLSFLSIIFITGKNPDYGIVTTFIKLIALMCLLKPLAIKMLKAERGD